MDETAKMGIGLSHQIAQQLIFTKRVYGDYKTDISCVVAKGTLL